MGFKKWGGWNRSSDGSAMKVSHQHGVMKTERISSSSRPHDHTIVKADRVSGRVRETYVGPNAKRGK